MQLPISKQRPPGYRYGGIPRINWQHPLAKGLVSYMYDTGFGPVIDLVSGDICASVGTAPAIAGSYLGPSRLYSNGGGMIHGANHAVMQNLTQAAPYSVAAGYIQTGTAGGGGDIGTIFSFCDNVGNTPFVIAVATDGVTQTDWGIEFGNNTIVNNSTGNSNDVFHTIVGVATGSASEVIYLDGGNKTTGAIASTYSYTTGFVPAFNSQEGNTAFVNRFAGHVFYGAAWKLRALTQTEALWLHQDPFCLLVWPEDDLFAMMLAGIVAAGGTSFPVGVNISALSSIALARSVAKKPSLSAPSSVSAIKQADRSLTLSSPSIVASLKRAGKILSMSSGGAVSPIKRAGKVLSASSGSTVSPVKRVAKLDQLSSTSSVVVSTARRLLKALSVLSTSSVSVVKSAGRKLAVSSTSAVSQVKQVGKRTAFASASAVVASAIKARLVTIAITSASAVSHAISVGKRVSISSASAVSSVKYVGKRTTIAAASTVAVAKRIGKAIALASTSVVAVTVGRAFTVLVNVASASAVTVKRSIGHAISVASSASVSSTKAVSTGIAFGSAATVSMVKGIGKKIAVAAASIVSIVATKFTGNGTYNVVVNIVSTSDVLVSKAVALHKLIVAPSSTVIQSLVIGAHAYARRIIGMAASLLVSGRQNALVVSGNPAIKIVGTPMTTIHDPQGFVCGDNWQIVGTLNDANGVPLNLTGATISWKLDAIDGLTNHLSLDNAGAGGITITNSSTATIFVNVTALQSAAIPAGNYRDWLRVTLADGTVLTEWTGIINATANPA